MNKSKFLLSIILPLLDAEDDIYSTFTHLATQTGVDKSKIEIIIVNDGSTDNTPQTIADHSELLTDFAQTSIITHETRQGLAKTRLDGAEAASGKFITFLDKKMKLDDDYLANFLNKNRNIIIGNPYMIKSRSAWGRVLAVIRKKLYYPYFNNDFQDIDLDYDSYIRFKNKGGGGCMLVLRDYYLRVASNLPTGVHVNDDSLLVSELSKIEPILKTSTVRSEYLNRKGFTENMSHLYGRGPKFVDFYARPGTRFFPMIVGLIIAIVLLVAALMIQPSVIIYFLLALVILTFVSSVYLAEEIRDFFWCFVIIPIALFAFCAGIIKGLLMKVFRKY